jgi:hypothetical protein
MREDVRVGQENERGEGRREERKESGRKRSLEGKRISVVSRLPFEN